MADGADGTRAFRPAKPAPVSRRSSPNFYCYVPPNTVGASSCRRACPGMCRVTSSEKLGTLYEAGTGQEWEEKRRKEGPEAQKHLQAICSGTSSCKIQSRRLRLVGRLRGHAAGGNFAQRSRLFALIQCSRCMRIAEVFVVPFPWWSRRDLACRPPERPRSWRARCPRRRQDPQRHHHRHQCRRVSRQQV